MSSNDVLQGFILNVDVLQSPPCYSPFRHTVGRKPFFFGLRLCKNKFTCNVDRNFAYVHVTGFHCFICDYVKERLWISCRRTGRKTAYYRSKGSFNSGSWLKILQLMTVWFIHSELVFRNVFKSSLSSVLRLFICLWHCSHVPLWLCFHTTYTVGFLNIYIIYLFLELISKYHVNHRFLHPSTAVLHYCFVMHYWYWRKMTMSHGDLSYIGPHMKEIGFLQSRKK